MAIVSPLIISINNLLDPRLLRNSILLNLNLQAATRNLELIEQKKRTNPE